MTSSTSTPIQEGDRLSAKPYRKKLSRSLDALELLRQFVARFVVGEQIQEGTDIALELAAEELFTNLVRHNESGSPTIDVSLSRCGDQISLRLEDLDVESFDPALLPTVDPDLPVEQRTPGGLGVFLVRSSFDDLRYEYADRVLTVTATRKVGPSVRNPVD